MSDSTMETDKFGIKRWKNSKGQYHRTDGPAVVGEDGIKSWFVNGQFHRLNGPAVEYSNGENAWYVHGEFLGFDDEGFWALWDILTPEQKQDHTLLSYLPGDYNV